MLMNFFFTMLVAFFYVPYPDVSPYNTDTKAFSFHRFFEDIELHKDKDSSKFRFKKDGKKHTLIIQEATLDDIGMYHAWTNGGHTKGELEVEGTIRKYSIIFLVLFLLSPRIYSY